ncbi:COMPASS (complex proteins associated with Set1p) component [Onygenales sp. PD_40]|nr:COMPASS (complex proteins associated with Set1p) component [Onygenales sp. PD_40]
MAETPNDPSSFAVKSEPPPLHASLDSEARSSHSTPQLGAESQRPEPPAMRNVDTPSQQLPEADRPPYQYTTNLPTPATPTAAAPITSSSQDRTLPTDQPRPRDVTMRSVPNIDEKPDIAMGGAGLSQQAQAQVPISSAAATSTTNNNNASTPIPQVRAGGAPARIYMNEKIVPYLLEGMKTLAKDQ